MKKHSCSLSCLVRLPARRLAQDNASLQADDKQWVMPGKDYAQTRFSRLNQITAANAGKLQVAWTFSVGSNHGQEAAPIGGERCDVCGGRLSQ